MEAIDILAFGAHPDDVELTCAGLLIKMGRMGYRTGVVDLTRGEMGTRGTPETRRAEADAAAQVMGLAVRENLGLPDGHIQADTDQKQKVVGAIRKYRPSLLALPYREDPHPDHQNASRLIFESSYLSGLEKYRPEHGAAHRPAKLIYYPGRPGFSETRPSFIVDVSDVFEQRLKAIECYRSQLYDEGSRERPTEISSRDYLDRIIATARYYGVLAGVKYGEPYFCREIIRVNDPMAQFIRGVSGDMRNAE